MISGFGGSKKQLGWDQKTFVVAALQKQNALRRRHGNIGREGNEVARHNKSQGVAELFILLL